MTVPAEVHVSGPLFDESRSNRYAFQMMRDIVTTVSSAASERVHFYLDSQIKHPTPYYETQVNTRIDDRGPKVWSNSVNDRGVIYGAWLEGTSSRNQSTRFKGYASFRKATTATNREVSRLVRQPVAEYTHKMNGR